MLQLNEASFELTTTWVEATILYEILIKTMKKNKLPSLTAGGKDFINEEKKTIRICILKYNKKLKVLLF